MHKFFTLPGLVLFPVFLLQADPPTSPANAAAASPAQPVMTPPSPLAPPGPEDLSHYKTVDELWDHFTQHLKLVMPELQSRRRHTPGKENAKKIPGAHGGDPAEACYPVTRRTSAFGSQDGFGSDEENQA